MAQVEHLIPPCRRSRPTKRHLHVPTRLCPKPGAHSWYLALPHRCNPSPSLPNSTSRGRNLSFRPSSCPQPGQSLHGLLLCPLALLKPLTPTASRGTRQLKHTPAPQNSSALITTALPDPLPCLTHCLACLSVLPSPRSGPSHTGYVLVLHRGRHTHDSLLSGAVCRVNSRRPFRPLRRSYPDLHTSSGPLPHSHGAPWSSPTSFAIRHLLIRLLTAILPLH